MICPNLLEDGNPCGDEGRACDACMDDAMREHSWMRGVPLSSVTGVMSEQDKQDVRDAGRGHLVDGAAAMFDWADQRVEREREAEELRALNQYERQTTGIDRRDWTEKGDVAQTDKYWQD